MSSNDHKVVVQYDEVDINQIKPYDSNPRNNDHAVEPLCQSIRQFGFTQPIVIDEDGIIVAGHTRWKAAKKAGITMIPVALIQGLSERQKRAYRILDNRIRDKSEWDMEKLSSELDDIKLDLTQFSYGWAQKKLTLHSIMRDIESIQQDDLVPAISIIAKDEEEVCKITAAVEEMGHKVVIK